MTSRMREFRNGDLARHEPTGVMIRIEMDPLLAAPLVQGRIVTNPAGVAEYEVGRTRTFVVDQLQVPIVAD